MVGHIITTDLAQDRLKINNPINKTITDEPNMYTQSNNVAVPVLANT
jgi:hypothetical protein